MGKAQQRKKARRSEALKNPEAVREEIKGSRLLIYAAIIIPVIFAVISFNRGYVWQASASMWGDVVEKSPQKARGLSSLGGAIFKRGSVGYVDEAIALYERAVILKDDYAAAPYNLGLGYEAKGRLREAEEELKEAIRLKNNYAKAFNALGTVYVKLKRYGEAIESYEEAVKVWPTYPQANYNLGTRYGEAGRFKEAVKHLGVAIRYKPDYVKAYYNRGIFYAREGVNAKAASNFAKVLEFTPNDEGAKRLFKEYSSK